MRILLTNDDGVDSPGLLALATALVDADHEVLVVAPTTDRSGASAAIGPLHRLSPIPVIDHVWESFPGLVVRAIDAPPATAVYAACLEAFGPPPDLVVSGINPGANTGHLVLHSGTVGAALTAAGLGVSGLAVSITARRDERHWSTAAELAAAAVPWVGDPTRRPCVVSLNVPNATRREIKGVRAAELAPYGEVWVASADPATGDLRLDFQGHDRKPPPNSDLALLRDGYATVTLLSPIAHVESDGPAPFLDAVLTRGG